MLKSLLADALIGAFVGVVIVSMTIPFAPDAFRGPVTAILVWIGIIVIVPLGHVLWRRRNR
ncbi:MAG: hypothetical protein HY654_12595 [Acidobacteria bacterium]|nr:hypothetical protein [Acidobacteriota bacterium]